MIEKRTCKHLRKLHGDAAEEARIGGALPQRPPRSKDEGDAGEDAGPPLLLAESWDNATDLSGWWMSEKLDGVRAYWNGKQFLSRHRMTPWSELNRFALLEFFDVKRSPTHRRSRAKNTRPQRPTQ